MRASIIILAFFPSIILAAQQIPVVSPLTSETTLYLTPTFTSTCKKTVYEKKGWFPTKKMSDVAVTTSEDTSGTPLVTMVVGENGLEIKLVFRVSASRTTLSGINSFDVRQIGTTVWTSTENLSGKARESMASVKQMLAYMLENSSSIFALGKPLKQGMVMEGDVCRIIPSAITLSSSGGFAVTGTATINGRNSLVFKGAQSASCSVGNQTLSIAAEGWYALDVESGLEIAQSVVSQVKVGSTNWVGENESECQISGLASKVALGNRSVENRLIEVKSLFDKDLISGEQLEQKRAEILKSLP